MPEQRSDHPERRSAIPDGAIDLLALVEMGQEVVAVALEVVANEVGVVAVGDEADALGEERIVDLDLLEPDRSDLAGDLGDPGDLIDQLALGRVPHRERELGAERQAMEDRDERKPDQGGGERAAENDDDGMIGKIHAEIATHQDDGRDDYRSADETEACRDVHGEASATQYGAPPAAALLAT